MKTIPKLRVFLCALALIIIADCCLYLNLTPFQPVNCDASDFFCEVCNWAMDELDKSLDENASPEQILAAVKTVCSKLPSFLKDACDELIDAYGPEIIRRIEEHEKLEDICGKLGPSPVCTQ